MAGMGSSLGGTHADRCGEEKIRLQPSEQKSWRTVRTVTSNEDPGLLLKRLRALADSTIRKRDETGLAMVYSWSTSDCLGKRHGRVENKFCGPEYSCRDSTAKGATRIAF